MDASPLLGFDPDDPDAWAVLGDWLTACGDPRGLMLALEGLEHGGQAGAPSDQLEALRRDHMHRYREALWPVFNVNSEVAARRHVELRWRAGLVIAARLLGPVQRPPEQIAGQIDGLLRSEAALALAELRCDRVDPRPVVDALIAGPPRPTIRALTLGDHRTPMPALDRLWAKLPGLRELELCGPGIDLDRGAADPSAPGDGLARLTRLRLSCELDPSPLRLLAGRPLPRLRALELRLGGDDYFGPRHANLADFAAPAAPAKLHRLSAAGLGRTGELLSRLLDGDVTPGLERLGITGIGFADELVGALMSSALLPRLRSLDLSDSRFAPHRRSLLGLDDGVLELFVGASDLGAEQLARLRQRLGERLHAS